MIGKPEERPSTDPATPYYYSSIHEVSEGAARSQNEMTAEDGEQALAGWATWRV